MIDIKTCMLAHTRTQSVTPAARTSNPENFLKVSAAQSAEMQGYGAAKGARVNPRNTSARRAGTKGVNSVP